MSVGYEEQKVAQEFGDPLLKTLYDLQIVDKKFVVRIGKVYQDLEFGVDRERNEIIVSSKHLQSRLERLQSEARKYGARLAEEDKREMQGRIIREYALRAAIVDFRYRSQMFPDTKDPIMVSHIKGAEEELVSFIESLIEYEDPTALMKEIRKYGKTHRVGTRKAEIYDLGADLTGGEGGRELREKASRLVDPIYGRLLGMAAALSRKPREYKISLARSLMRTTSLEIPSKLDYLAKEGLLLYGEREMPLDEADEVMMSAKEAAGKAPAPNAAKQAVVIIFLVAIGTLFLLPQLPNQMTAAFSLLPASNLLFVNFLVAIMIIMLIYVFSSKK